jgi:hypothetical protein
MGRPRKWKSDAERMAAKRAAESADELQAMKGIAPPRSDEEEPIQPVEPEKGVVQQGALEQALRDHYGYGKSEKRTQAERQAAADRILGRESSAPSSPEELGRRYGADEADRRQETAEKREWRIQRAIAYQRFLHAGKE